MKQKLTHSEAVKLMRDLFSLSGSTCEESLDAMFEGDMEDLVSISKLVAGVYDPDELRKEAMSFAASRKK